MPTRPQEVPLLVAQTRADPVTQQAIPTLLLTILCLIPALAQAQIGIGSGRERDVLRLIEPYRDEGPVGAAKLTGIVIQRNRIVLQVRDLAGQAADLVLLPVANSGPDAFTFEPGPAPTPALRQAQQLLQAAIAGHDDGTFFRDSPFVSDVKLGAPKSHSPDAPSPLKLASLQVLVGLLWLVLIVALAATLLKRPSRWRRLLLLFATWAIALHARESVPFWALHANPESLHKALSQLGRDWHAGRLRCQLWRSR